MSQPPVQIKRYPNRRYYARNTRGYVSLEEIEAMVKAGDTVEIRDSQTGDDLTRMVLTQIVIERQPEKMALFPSDMLHFIVRSNKVMSDFLRDYFRHSLTYLDYLQRHSQTAPPFAKPIHWVQAWLESLSQTPAGTGSAPSVPQTPASEPSDVSESASKEAAPPDDPTLGRRIEELEERIRELESKDDT